MRAGGSASSVRCKLREDLVGSRMYAEVEAYKTCDRFWVHLSDEPTVGSTRIVTHRGKGGFFSVNRLKRVFSEDELRGMKFQGKCSKRNGKGETNLTFYIA